MRELFEEYFDAIVEIVLMMIVINSISIISEILIK